MSTYAIVGADGVVSNVAVADEPLNIDGLWVNIDSVTPPPGIGWGYDGTVFTPPPAPPAPVQQPLISKAAMISRFTSAEFIGIITAAKTDVEVEAWYALFSAAEVVNLQDPRTIAGMDMLVSKNLVTQARATEILTDPIQPYERP